MTRNLHHRLLALAAGLVTLLVTAAPATASAATPATAFASIASTPDGCRGVTISSISDTTGVRYYHHGKRLHFPTRELKFDQYGVIELTAKPKAGYTISQRRAQLSAPAQCFTDITRDDQLPRYQPIVSWCSDDSEPYLGQAFYNSAADNVAATWQLVRQSNHKVVAAGHFTINAGDEGESQFPIPAGLPLGKYVLTVRNDASSATLYPYSQPVEQYHCVGPATVRTGNVTIRIPKHGPDATITFSVPSSEDPVKVVNVRAGHHYTFHTTEGYVEYQVTPRGNHVGLLGSGSAYPPQS